VQSPHKAVCATFGPPIARQRLTEHGDEIGGGTFEEFATRVRRDHSAWRPRRMGTGTAVMGPFPPAWQAEALRWYVEAEPVGDHLQRYGVALAPLPPGQ
jgi:hypothetical protein